MKPSARVGIGGMCVLLFGGWVASGLQAGTITYIAFPSDAQSEISPRTDTSRVTPGEYR